MMMRWSKPEPRMRGNTGLHQPPVTCVRLRNTTKRRQLILCKRIVWKEDCVVRKKAERRRIIVRTGDPRQRAGGSVTMAVAIYGRLRKALAVGPSSTMGAACPI